MDSNVSSAKPSGVPPARAAGLSGSARRALERMAGDCRRVLGGNFVAVVATDGQSAVVFAARLTAADIAALGALVDTWHHDGLNTPLLLTPDEFRRSLDAFPIEYQALIDTHVVIAGTPPFDGATIHPAQLRRACEVQAKGHLIHLRQGWLRAAGDSQALAALLVRSSAPLRALLSNVARLHGVTSADDAHAADEGARLASLPDALVRAVLALADAPDGAASLVSRLPEYLAASEQLWAFVDGWSVAP